MAVEFAIYFDTSPAASRLHLMEVEGTATIRELLLPETATRQRMGMVDHDFWGVGHLVAVVQSAVAKFAVFRRREGGRRVKAAYGAEAVCGQR